MQDMLFSEFMFTITIFARTQHVSIIIIQFNESSMRSRIKDSPTAKKLHDRARLVLVLVLVLVPDFANENIELFAVLLDTTFEDVSLIS